MSNWEEYGLLPLRIALGIVFIYHGYLKLFGGQFPNEFFGSLGIPLPYVFAIIVSVLEFFGGIALVLGLLTRYTGLLLSINMLVAILLVHLPNGFLVTQGGMEFPLALLGGALTLAMMGSGKLSVDDYMS